MTVRRLRSTTRVSGPLCFSISALLPTDTLALDRQRLSNREPVVHGDDLAVQQHDVRRRLRRRRFPGEGDGCKDKGTYDEAHDDLLEAAACHSIMLQTRVNARAKSAVPARDLGQAGTKPDCRPPQIQKGRFPNR